MDNSEDDDGKQITQRNNRKIHQITNPNQTTSMLVLYYVMRIVRSSTL